MLKRVLSSLETVSAEGFKTVPQTAEIVSDLVYRLRWFLMTIVVLVMVKEMLPYLAVMWAGKSIFSFLSLLLLR